MNIWTASMAYQGSDRLDITVKNTILGQLGWTLAPTWELVGGYRLWLALSTDNQAEMKRWCRYQPLSPDQYAARYYDLIRDKYRQHQALFLAVLQRDRTFCCFCKTGAFCHRYLVIDILSKIAAKHSIECVVYGEH